jgi:hypothetical protein
MNNMGSVSSKVRPASTLTIGLPLSRDVRIVAHVWPAEKPTHKDIRFHIYAPKAEMEVEILTKILTTYADTITRRPDDSQIGCIVQQLLITLLQKKCEELGFNMRWVIFDK